MKRNAFSAREDIFLREHFCLKTNRELARALGRSKGSVSCRMHKLGLMRSDEVRERMKGLSQFRKNHVPFNKGRFGIHLSPATEFKKGHLPHNTKFDGSIRVRIHRPTKTAYKYIRVALGKWELLHRHNWKKTHGEIPPHHIVSFKDGDTLNCDAENLCLMSRADNARRNSNRAKAACSMRESWRHISDKHIAALLSCCDEHTRADILRRPDLIELKRSQLKLRRALREVNSETITRPARGDGRQELCLPGQVCAGFASADRGEHG